MNTRDSASEENAQMAREAVAVVAARAARAMEKMTGFPSLRDWFAGQALAGLCAGDCLPDTEECEKYAACAYRLADAMLAARAKGAKSDA